MPRSNLALHPIAHLFPEMSGPELDALVVDIGEHGQRVPLLLHEGKVVDGRHRLLACEALGITPKTEEWTGEGSVIDHVVALNLHRRHLTASQKAAVALGLLAEYEKEAKRRQKQGKAKLPDPRAAGQARDDAAQAVGASARNVQDLKKVQARAPQLIAQVKAGKLSVSAALAQVEDKAPPSLSTLWHRLQSHVAAAQDIILDIQEAGWPWNHREVCLQDAAQKLAGALRRIKGQGSEST
jgi:hypothetical protein